MPVLIRLVRGDTSTDFVTTSSECPSVSLLTCREVFCLNSWTELGRQRTDGRQDGPAPFCLLSVQLSWYHVMSPPLSDRTWEHTHTLQLCMMGCDGSVSHRGPSQVATVTSSLAWQVTPLLVSSASSTTAGDRAISVHSDALRRGWIYMRDCADCGG